MILQNCRVRIGAQFPLKRDLQRLLRSVRVACLNRDPVPAFADPD